MKQAKLLAGEGLPEGVKYQLLTEHPDERGILAEIYREDWVGQSMTQWNCVRSKTNTLRGVHGHFHHADYLFVAQGTMLLGLYDIRPDSSTLGQNCLVELKGEQPATVYIPTGVLHGFYFPEPSMLFYGLSHGWSTDDEMTCQWNDPDLNIPWPCTEPLLSERDTNGDDLASVTRQYTDSLQS